MGWRLGVLAVVGIVYPFQIVIRNANDLGVVATTITAPTSGTTYDAGTSATLTTLAGTATSDRQMVACTWVNSLGGSGAAQGAGSWSVSSIALTVGSNVITVTCNNLTGGSSQDVVTVTRSAAGGSTACADAQTGGTARYVRAGASGTNTGLDWTNAHTTLPTPVRGRTYCVADGTYAGDIILSTAESGTTRITIQKATVADHGISTGWSDAFGDGEAVWDVPTAGGAGNPAFAINTGYWTISGSARSALESGYGFKCTADEVVAATQTCFRLESESNLSGLIIEYVHGVGRDQECDGSGNGAEFYYDNGVTANNGSNGTIIRANFWDGMNNPVTIHETDDIVFEYNVTDKIWSAGPCHAEIIAGSGDDNVTYRYNWARELEGTGGVICLGRVGILTCDGWKIYGNVFWGTNTENIGDGVVACINNMVCTNWVVYNNTIVDMNSGRMGFDGDGSSITIRNNLWQDSVSAAIACSGSGTVCTISHNVYTDTTGENGSETSIQVRDAFDWFVDSAGTTFDQVNFDLVEDTNTWSSLSSPYNVDIAGVTRTSSRGAYQFGSPPGPLPLSVLHSWARSLYGD